MNNTILKTLPLPAVIVLILALIFNLSSCQNGAAVTKPETSGQTGSETAETETTEIPDNLPERDFGEYNFRVYIRDQEHYNTDFYAESETGDLINDAVFARNRKIEERFNTRISIIFYPVSENPAAQKSILAGDDVYDIMAMHGAYAFQIGQQKLALDWFADMPYVDFTAPWWSQDMAKNLSAFGKLYCTTGDISYLGLESTGCMLFNKDLFDNLGVEYPYKDVLDGKWTLDKFSSIVKTSFADLNGDGVMAPGDDRYGADIFNQWSYPITVFYCGGDRVITINSDGIPELTVYNERTVDIFNKFFSLIDSGGAYVRPDLGSGEFAADTPFRAGRALILTTIMSDVIRHRDLEYEIGVLPFPKYDENTPKHYANPDAGQNVLVVPITVPDAEPTSVITEALAAESYRSVTPALYEVSLKTKYSRDNESELMLDFIKAGIIYDYGYFDSAVAWELAYIGRNLYALNDRNFTSFYEKRADRVRANIEKLSDN